LKPAAGGPVFSATFVSPPRHLAALLFRAVALAGLAAAPAALHAHALTITQVLVSFDAPGRADVRVDIDLTPWLGPDDYHALALAGATAQRAAVEKLLPDIREGLQLFAGPARLELEFQECALPRASLEEFRDPVVDKYTVLRFRAALPADGAPLQLVVTYDTRVPHPVAFTARIPAAGIESSTLLEEGGSESEPFAWAAAAPGRKPAGAARPAPAAPDRGPWTRELASFLRAGFRHIVPTGADHMLFVLGLFFLGITWRKLLVQTTVFTVAHATTLYLATAGIFSLPSRWVEPAIALSIAFIALENVRSPKLSPARLAVVFGFGLVHGLGFATGLRELARPRHDFLLALLGFNFGVDFGQLSVIGLAFLAVGWCRDRPWFRARVAVPCSLVIAAIGLGWAVQRIVYYWF
jgi:hypothetical protein